MLAGHIDEIGVMVTHIDDDGFVSFDAIGGWDHQVFVGQRVRLLGRGGPVVGVVGKKAIHLMDKDDREKVSKVEDLWIDIGAASRAEAQERLRIGDPGVLAAGVLEFPNGRLVSRSIDNRIGAFVVLEAARLYSQGKAGRGASVTAVATTREEIASTGGGARSSAVTLEPDVAIVVDVTHATDYPGIDKRKHGDYRLGGGPVISRGASVSEVVFELLATTAEAEGIPVLDRGGLARHPHRRRKHLQCPSGCRDGARLGAQPLHAQPQRDGRTRRPRPHRAPPRGLCRPPRRRYRLRSSMTAVPPTLLVSRAAMALSLVLAAGRATASMRSNSARRNLPSSGIPPRR